MKHPLNQYEFDKLNDDFDKKLDNLRDEYAKKAQEIFSADAQGVSLTEGQNKVWVWFDSITDFKTLPKIMFVVTIANIVAVVMCLKGSFASYFEGFDSGFVYGALLLLLIVQAIYYLIVFGGKRRQYGSGAGPYDFNTDIVGNPAFKDLECNAWHK